CMLISLTSFTCWSVRDLHSFPTRRSSDLSNTDRPGEASLARPRVHDLLARFHSRSSNDARRGHAAHVLHGARDALRGRGSADAQDRKSTRLNSSHVKISYAVFCLKKKRDS